MCLPAGGTTQTISEADAKLSDSLSSSLANENPISTGWFPTSSNKRSGLMGMHQATPSS